MTRDNTPDDAPVYVSQVGEATKAKPDATEQKTPPVERDALLARLRGLMRQVDAEGDQVISEVLELLAQPALSGEDTDPNGMLRELAITRGKLTAAEAEVTRLSGEVAALEASIQHDHLLRLKARAEAAEALLAKLREAAAPFVSNYAPWMDEHPDSASGNFASTNFGQLRALHQALSDHTARNLEVVPARAVTPGIEPEQSSERGEV